MNLYATRHSAINITREYLMVQSKYEGDGISLCLLLWRGVLPIIFMRSASRDPLFWRAINWMDDFLMTPISDGEHLFDIVLTPEPPDGYHRSGGCFHFELFNNKRRTWYHIRWSPLIFTFPIEYTLYNSLSLSLEAVTVADYPVTFDNVIRGNEKVGNIFMAFMTPPNCDCLTSPIKRQERVFNGRNSDRQSRGCHLNRGLGREKA